MSEIVCAVVVTFNRKELLIECLDSLLQQTRPLQGIYIIDNASSDGTPQLLLNKDFITELPPEDLTEPWEKNTLSDKSAPVKIHYVRMHENSGGAGGFHEGVKWGYEKGYDWLWLMDDDAEPKENALELMMPFTEIKDVVGISNLKVGLDGKIQYCHRGWKDICRINHCVIKQISDKDLINDMLEIDHSSFVGLMVSKKAVQKIGFPRKEFFIQYDDVEYSFRLRTIGRIVLIKDSVILHKDGSKSGGIYKKFLLKTSLRNPFSSLWLSYYCMRNFIYLKKVECGFFIVFLTILKIAYKSTIRSTIGILLFDDHKLKRIKFIIHAYLDGLNGNFDNEKPKRILYGKKSNN